jgi:tyrosyl-tRNA synthetase
MHEIMYPLLQAYDSVAIESDVELGATEQKFNILCGRDMQRYYGMEQQIAVLSPILLGTDGVNKMGKSLNNYIAVFDPPAEKFGKVMSIPDSLILNYYSYATSYSPERLQEVKDKLASGMNPMLLKKRLAWEIVALYHGETEAQKAQDGFESLFSKGEIPEDIPDYELSPGRQRVANILVASGLCSTNGEAKRLIMGGGVSIDGEKIAAWDQELEPQSGMILRAGKRKFARIKVV